MKDILLNMSINAMKDNFLVLDDDMKQKEFCKLLDENQQLKQQLEHCYCNRTDCSARIKDSKKYNSLQQDYDNLKQQLEEEKNIRNKAIEELKTLIHRINYEEDFYVEDYDIERIITILQNKE